MPWPESAKSPVPDKGLAGQGMHGQGAAGTRDAGSRERAQELLSVGQVAQRGGVSVSALHFYERLGLISSTRTSGNQRRFARSELRRVAVIKAAQRAGIPLALVATVFEELPAQGVPTQADWQRLSEHWQGELTLRIAALEKLRGSLGGCIGCGCLSLADCSFVNPGDQAATPDRAASTLEPASPPPGEV